VPALPTEALATAASFVISAVAVLAGLWLLRLGSRPWPGLVEAAPA